MRDTVEKSAIRARRQSVTHPSSLKALVARILRGNVAAHGGYVFDLRGRWRYEPRTSQRSSGKCGTRMSLAQISAMTRV